MLTKLQFLHHPKLYLLSKFFLISCIILQRVIIIVKNEKPGLTAYFVVQIALLPLLFVLEFLLLWFFSRTKVRKGIGILSILIIQILFSQGFVELSLCIFPNTEREYTEVIFQEIYFLNSLVILFSESRVLKGILMFYIAILSLFRFSNFAESVLYISWCLIAIIIIFSTLIIFRKRKIFKPPPEPSHQKHNFKIETEVEGVVIIAKDKSVLAMNGLFRGMLEEDSENLALEKLLNLRKFESYPAEFQKALLNEIKLTKLQLPKNFKESRSFGDIPKSTTALIKSLEVPTSRAGKTINPQQRPSFFQRPSIFQRGSLFQRPSIFQRTSIMANRKISHHVSAASSKIDTQTQLTTGRGPLIKINLSKADEEQTESIRPGQGVGDESDTRSPLIKATPGQGFGDSFLFPTSRGTSKEIKNAANFSLKEENNIDFGLEHIEVRVDTYDKFSPLETIGNAVENAFGYMANTIDKRHNLVLSQLIEHEPNPIEAIKRGSLGLYPNKPESTSMGSNSSQEKINVVLKEPKKRSRILEVTLSPFIYQNKDCMCISVRDVSYEMKCKDLGEILDHKDKVLRYVSHELRTPLNGVLPILESLMNANLSSHVLQDIKTVLNSSKMLQVLVNDFLDFARMQARKFKITIIPCKMKKLIEEIIEVMGTQASMKNIKIRLQWDPKIPNRFYTDPNRLKQIIYNLVGNSLKFTSRGFIIIQASYIHPTICKISVTDTGVGISKENLKKLFKEFGKITENSNLNPYGIGLGLVISNLLSQELSPDSEGLMVDSEEGKGTTFYFFLESKIESFDEFLNDNYELQESLDEQGDNSSTINQTTYHKTFGEINTATFSFKTNKDSKKLPPLKVRGNEKHFSLSPPNLKKRGSSSPSPTYGSHLTNPFYKFGDMNLVLSPKKKSSDNIILKSRQSPSTILKNSFGKEIRAGSFRTYSLEDLNDTVTSKNYNAEFDRILKNIQPQCPNPKVLIVDDHPYNIQALEALMRSFKIECVSAADGEMAIQEVLKNEGDCLICKNYKIIFMDVQMPKINGFETTKILRKKMLEGEISFIPIIGVTGYSASESRVECLTSGMMDLVSKPVSLPVVRELLMKWMGI